MMEKEPNNSWSGETNNRKRNAFTFKNLQKDYSWPSIMEIPIETKKKRISFDVKTQRVQQRQKKKKQKNV